MADPQKEAAFWLEQYGQIKDELREVTDHLRLVYGACGLLVVIAVVGWWR